MSTHSHGDFQVLHKAIEQGILTHIWGCKGRCRMILIISKIYKKRMKYVRGVLLRRRRSKNERSSLSASSVMSKLRLPLLMVSELRLSIALSRMVLRGMTEERLLIPYYSVRCWQFWEEIFFGSQPIKWQYCKTLDVGILEMTMKSAAAFCTWTRHSLFSMILIYYGKLVSSKERYIQWSLLYRCESNIYTQVCLIDMMSTWTIWDLCTWPLRLSYKEHWADR